MCLWRLHVAMCVHMRLFIIWKRLPLVCDRGQPSSGLAVICQLSDLP
jgi:hypothetical protein